MRATDQIHVVLLQEARDDVRPERERYATIILTPSGDVFVGIGPEEIAEKSTIGNLGRCVSDRGSSEIHHCTLTSVGRMTRLICSMELRSGLRPPCMVKIFSSMMAAIGKQLKQSVNVFHSLML